jgi:hypothetical protein
VVRSAGISTRFGSLSAWDSATGQDRVDHLKGLGHAPFWEEATRFNAILERFVLDVAR